MRRKRLSELQAEMDSLLEELSGIAKVDRDDLRERVKDAVGSGLLRPEIFEEAERILRSTSLSRHQISEAQRVLEQLVEPTPDTGQESATIGS